MQTVKKSVNFGDWSFQATDLTSLQQNGGLQQGQYNISVVLAWLVKINYLTLTI